MQCANYLRKNLSVLRCRERDIGKNDTIFSPII